MAQETLAPPAATPPALSSPALSPHAALAHRNEPASNAERANLSRVEPRALRTYTPSQAVLVRSAGVYHWTPEGRRLYDFTSGVLVANLGHNPISWMRQLGHYLHWVQGTPTHQGPPSGHLPMSDVTVPVAEVPAGFRPAVTLTAYNAITPVEREATLRLVETLRDRPGGKRMEQVLWAASGSEAVQKALWACMARDRTRPMILATRHGFHGKKGLANAVTGSETDAERDPRVKFISFPMAECKDITLRDAAFDPTSYRKELEAAYHQYGRKIGALITEPYLGGGGSYHPPKAYLQLLQNFCREHDIIFILDEVQANFGRTNRLFAFETYGLEPDLVVLGKGLGNGVPVAAVVGRADLFGALDYGEGSDTWSANPLCCAAVLATLDGFAERDLIAHTKRVSPIIEAGLLKLKSLPFIAAVRGEQDGMVWGVETKEYAGRSATEWANAFVLSCYRGESRPDGKSEGIHLLGALAKKVIRISPPLVITEAEATASVELLNRLLTGLLSRVPGGG